MTTKTKPINRYELLAGGHTESRWVQVDAKDAESTTTKIIPRVNPISGKTTYYRLETTHYEVGDIVETERDLVDVFDKNNIESKRKFKKLEKNENSSFQESINTQKLLNKMTYIQLCDHAADEEIDIEGLKSKKEVIEAITGTKEFQST
jgi:hypothetical protein